MDREKERSVGISAGTLLLWQVLAFACSFFACGFLTGLEGIFCALAAALTAGLLLARPFFSSCLGALAGALAGYAFALWNTDGGVLRAVFTHTALPDSVELMLDLRIFGAVCVCLLAASCGVTVFCVKKGYARTVCVAINAALFVLAQGGSFLVFVFQKYSSVSLSLLQEKLALLVQSVEAYLTSFLQAAGETAAPYAALLSEIAYGLVYSLPALGVAYGCVCAFFLSFVLKRLLQKSGHITHPRQWMFMPGLVSAVMYGVIFVLALCAGAFEPGSPAVYGLDLLDTVLSCAFFVPGLTAVRLAFSRRRSQGGLGGIGWILGVMLLPFLLPTVLGVLPTVGAVFVAVCEMRKRAKDKPNQR